jgi:hypothetical protein
MLTLKPISADAVPRAIEKAEHYRLLNQPWAAESICQDILAAAPGHQKAVRLLLLACTDQFSVNLGNAVTRAADALAQLTDPYEHAYYAGIMCERRARAQLERRGPGAGALAYESIREAMAWFEQAMPLRPAGNDDPALRWNTCARLLNSSSHVAPRGEERMQPVTGE